MRVMKQSRFGACGALCQLFATSGGRGTDSAPIDQYSGRGSRRRCAPRWMRASLCEERCQHPNQLANRRRLRRTGDDAVEDALFEANLLIRVPRPRQAPHEPLLALAPPAHRQPAKPSAPHPHPHPRTRAERADVREPRPAVGRRARGVDKGDGREAVFLVDGLPHARGRRASVACEALGIFEQVDVDALCFHAPQMW